MGTCRIAGEPGPCEGTGEEPSAVGERLPLGSGEPLEVGTGLGFDCVDDCRRWSAIVIETDGVVLGNVGGCYGGRSNADTKYAFGGSKRQVTRVIVVSSLLSEAGGD